MNRRDFLKSFWKVPVAIPFVAAAAFAEPVRKSGGDIIVEAGAEDTLVTASSLQGGNIIIKEGAKRTMVTGVLLTNGSIEEGDSVTLGKKWGEGQRNERA